MATTTSSKDHELHVSLNHWEKGQGNTYGSITIKFRYKTTKGFRSVDLKKRQRPLLTVSFTGSVTFQSTGGNHGGQCVETIRKIWGHRPEIAELCDLWDRWHLNDLRAGTRKQSEALRGKKNRSKHEHYTWACNYLKRKGLLVDQGYKYGAEWLFEEIPATVVKRIKSLAK
jgi:hypothetical protein